MSESVLLDQLIEALKCLPSVGNKSAQRMAFYLLERDREGGQRLSSALSEAMERIGHCNRCRTLSENELCRLCSNSSRNNKQLCIIETPSELMAIEQATDYRGRYFVLGGRLSPLDGIGPQELGLEQLDAVLAEGHVEELILATNPTIEGEVTAHYLSDMAGSYQVKVTRIAHGVPLGGELEYVDGGTLSHAFAGRRDY